MPLTKITTQEIRDLSLLNEDIATNANISDTKLAVIASAGKVANSATTATHLMLPNTIVSRDANSSFSANTVNLELLNVKNIIATVNISTPQAQISNIIVPISGFWNSNDGLNVNRALISAANIGSATIYDLTIEDITAQNITVQNLTVGSIDGSLVTEGTENIVRFSFPDFASFPDATTYSGTFAFAEDTEDLYISDGETWVSVSTNTNQIVTAPAWKKFTVAYSDFTDAANAEQILLATIPTQSTVTGWVIKHSTPFSGGTLTAYTVSLGTVATPDKFTSEFDVFQAASSSDFLLSTSVGMEDFGTWGVYVNAKCVGDTLDNAVAGSVDIWILVSTLS